ncbi:hybrid sensor histidine kinase/response regulator transcription factor [Wenyingzhuangia marina]|uniref:histidine kinase n=1 Tax=Wenyingzhuangia marina TaxID=1195760 RepID=A0A1M5W2N7_9FLAO|nr:two-component regulator propeller domain-containing protein [Wenyingzhuangia marina]GGF76482.1 hybrid sensor histidine kinase/response regulator [Wenyingzhuangia marina]SHH81484.1 Signal transduction histidine kinase [Wenyingzhuangia marina]
MNIKNFTYIFLFFNCLLFGQDNKDIEKERYRISYIDIKDGLANNSVTAIYKDKKGLMWIGTYDGVSRYDAYDFVNYRNQPNDTLTLINNKVTCISGTLNHIWIGTKKGVSVYDYLTNEFKRQFFLNTENKSTEFISSEVYDIKEYQSNVYIATAGQGLFYYDEKNEKLNRVSLKIGNEITKTYHVKGIEFDTSGTLWAVISEVGIVKMESGSNTLKIVYSGIKDGNCIINDGESNIWIGYEKGIYKYNISTNRHVNYSKQLKGYPIKDILCDHKKNELWIATDGNGVVKYNLKTDVFYHLSNSDDIDAGLVTSNAISTMYQDNDNRFWIGTLRGGVDIIESKKSPFTIISKKQNVANTLPSNFILSFSEQDPNHIWIGTDGGGVSLWNRTKDEFVNYSYNPNDLSSLPNNFVTGIVTTKKGTWFGTYGGGVSLFNTKTKKFKKYELLNTKNKEVEDYVWKLYESKEGELWVSTHNGGDGLYRYNKDIDQFEFVHIGYIGVICMTQDKNNNMWVGTFSELIKLDLNKNKHQSYYIGYPVQSIVEHAEDKMLIGTEGGGLIVFNPKTSKKRALTEADEISNNSILNIEKDNQGCYWLSTYNGITKFNADTNEIVKYYDSDGLQSNQFNYNASLKLSTGEILMGGIKGFNVIDSKPYSIAKDFPPLVINSIKVNNKPLSQFGKTAFGINEIELPFEDSMVTVEYAGLDYSFPEKISYAYFLEGWDSEWHEVGNIRTANYSKLTEGNYVLKIKSTNADGKWNNQTLTFPITILPPWYRTVWAYLLYVLIFALAIFVVDRYQRRQTELKFEIKLSKDLAAQEKELNEKKSTFFTNISHEFRSPLTMIINPLKDIVNSENSKVDPSVIEVVYKNSRRLLSLVDQLLLFRKTETETGKLIISRMDLVEACNEVFTCFTNHAKTKNIAYSFKSDVNELFVYADKQKIEIALFNLISNALKFTEKEGGEVKVRLNVLSGDKTSISVIDNGKGVTEEDKEKIFDLFYQTSKRDKSNRKGFGIGLYLVKEFVEQHQGDVACYDTKNGGTTFEIKLLKGKSHFGDVEIKEELEEEHIDYVEEVFEEVELIEKDENYEESKELVKNLKNLLVVDDNPEIRKYLKNILSPRYNITTAKSAEMAVEVLKTIPFDLIVSDVVMGEMNGVEFCRYVKTTEGLKHIPIILLSGGSTEGVKLESAEVGADDYITKPFDKDYLLARINGILTRRESVQKHLLNTVTKSVTSSKLSEEDKQLLDRIVDIIENKMEEESFNIKTLATEVGMSHSLLYKKIKKITGKSATEFTRGIRLRKVATLLITTDMQVNQVASMAGFGDLKYFRKQFQQFYDMNPSEFKKKYQNVKDKKYILNDEFWKSK